HLARDHRALHSFPTRRSSDLLIHAVDGDGALLWTSHTFDDQPAKLRVQNGGITLANLDADPAAEVVIGAAALDHDGRLVWDEQGDRKSTRLNSSHVKISYAVF